MKKYLAYALLMLPLLMTEAKSPKPEDTLSIKLKDGTVLIELYSDKAPKHVERIKKLANAGKYDGVAFHRVIDGFMAQTGDVEFGNKKDFNAGRVGTGGSDLPDLKEEFNDTKHIRGTCSMARAASPNGANSQFFICFEPAPFLTVNTLYGARLSKVWNSWIKLNLDHRETMAQSKTPTL